MTFLEAVTAFRGHMKLQRYSPATLKNYHEQLQRFGEWLTAQGMSDLRALNAPHISAYQQHVKRQPLGRETQALRLRAVKRLYGYLIEQGHLLLDPTSHIVEVCRRTRLPRPVLTPNEMDRLLHAPNTSVSLGVRDRALLEVLYATGIRVGELEGVTIHHLDLGNQTLQVRKAKNGRTRVVPLGKTATRWVKEYLSQVRPKLARLRPFERALFVGIGGRPLQIHGIRILLRQYAKRAKLKKAVSPHVLRHTCATHLLQRGADIRAIQALLGHVCLDTTVIYTRVAPREVKATHAQYHPSEQEASHGTA